MLALHVGVIEFQEGFAVVGGAGHAEEVAQVVEHRVVARVVTRLGQEPLAGFGGFIRFVVVGHELGGLVVHTRRSNVRA